MKMHMALSMIIMSGLIRSSLALQLCARSTCVQPKRTGVIRCAWEEVEGCQLLRPAQGQPRGLVHFLGGVFVSPSPQVAYRSLLESLSASGYAVLATPFAVDFDYRKPADDIYERYGKARRALPTEYAELPQLAMGHSLGALMQVLLCCWYPEYAEACTGAALLSFNNKPVKVPWPGSTRTLRRPAVAPPWACPSLS